jgi:2-polyprenyl-3-methyl-5-hydroxy-6-metoxy-1,4-benzoquinol methylase
VGDEELAAIIQAVRDRARSAVPNGSFGLEGVNSPDLMPLAHARDAAEAKVAAIGTVNPRPPGLKNSIAQGFKKLIARMLDWHVREQVEFNRAVMACVQTGLESMVDLSRGMAALAAHHRQLHEELLARERQLRQEMLDRQGQLREELAISQQQGRELLDMRRHWTEWRAGFEERRNASEIHMLRTLSEHQAAFQHRVTLLDQAFRELARNQHGEFKGTLAANTLDVQERLWKDLAKMRSEFETLIYTELRVLRQKQAAAAPVARAENDAAAQASAPPSSSVQIAPMPIDWMRFADAFRGPEDAIRERQKRYADRFARILQESAVEESAGREILDLGCGRGEFLEAAREAGLRARGIDQSQECIALCRAKGLAAEQADLFTYLAALEDRSLGGAFCSQVVEHLPPDRVPALVRLLAAKLRPGALAAIETPNPECLAIFATHFYLDPTHTRPIPPVLLGFYLEEAGMGNVEVERLAPAAESIPALNDLPASVRDALFGGQDYAIFAKKL